MLAERLPVIGGRGVLVQSAGKRREQRDGLAQSAAVAVDSDLERAERAATAHIGSFAAPDELEGLDRTRLLGAGDNDTSPVRRWVGRLEGHEVDPRRHLMLGCNLGECDEGRPRTRLAATARDHPDNARPVGEQDIDRQPLGTPRVNAEDTRGNEQLVDRLLYFVERDVT